MKRLAIILILLLLHVSYAVAQNNSEQNQLKAYYSSALNALEKRQWDQALSNVDNAQQLAGQNIAAFELVRIRAFHGKKDIARARRSIEIFNSLEPNESQKRQIASYITSVNDEIQQINNNFAQRWESEKKRLAQQKARIERLNAQLEAVNVGKEAYDLAVKLRDAFTRNSYYVGKLYNRLEYSGSIYEKGLGGTEMRYGRLVEKRPTIERHSFKILVNELANEVISTNWGVSLEDSEVRFAIRTEVNVIPGNCKIRKSSTKSFYSAKINISAPNPEDLLSSVQFRLSISKIRDWSLSIPLLSAFDDCNIATYRDERNQPTENSLEKRIYQSHLDYVNEKLRRIDRTFTLSESQRLAFVKDRERFEEYFMNAFFRATNINFEKLDNSIRNKEAKAAAEAEKAKEAAIFRQNQLAKIQTLRNRIEPLASQNQYEQIALVYKELIEVYRSIDMDPKELVPEIKEFQSKELVYMQKQYDSVINEALEAYEAKDYEKADSSLNQARYIENRYDIEPNKNANGLNLKIYNGRSERDRALEYAREFNLDNYYVYSDTEERLKLAIEFEPENEAFKKNLEAYYAKEKQKEFMGLIRQGDTELKNSNISTAILIYERALKVDPENSLGQNKLASAKAALSNKGKGKASLIEEIEEEIKNGDKYDEAFLSEARTKIQNYIKDYPQDAELIVAATALYIKEKLGLEEAFKMAQKAQEIDPNNLENLKNLGDLYYLSNDYPKAMEFYQKALELPKPLKDEVLQKLAQGHYTLALRTKDKSFENLAVEYANQGVNENVDHPVFERVLKRFCPANENCNR
ncbi:MAG: tetratricopeptide repeat protein [Flavobacteriaceae bacterium]|nr:tetratricopeptide repeat protein [Flavobacteriaceae bacterium]